MNTKFMKACFGLTIVLLLVSACGILPTLGSRHMITENRNVSGFDRVDVNGGGDVTIIQDGTESLAIQTDDNVMQYVTSEVRGGTLYIGLQFPNLRSVIPSRLSLTLHVKDLSGINTSGAWDVASESIQAGNLDIAISGSGKVNISMLKADKLNIDISGSGDMIMAGNVKTQDLSISGSGTYQAGDLQTQDTKVSVSGSGNVTVWASVNLNASVGGNGTINYYGSPQVSFDQSGSGKIKSLGSK